MSKRRNHPNFRTKVKHLLKDYQRNIIKPKDIEKWFRSFGLEGNSGDVWSILKSRVPSRIFLRLGKAALKKNAWVKIWDIVNKSGEYHKIPFYRYQIQTHIEVVETTNISRVEVDLNGNVKSRSFIDRKYKTISNTVSYSPYEEK